MKKTKILVPAMGMLLLSTAASITGTVAWFATNASVTATGMQLEAKSNNTYLLISKTNTTASTIQTENVKTVNMGLTGDASKVYPSAPILTSEEATAMATANQKLGGGAITVAGVVIDNDTKANTATNWYTASALAPAASTIDPETIAQLQNFTNYVVKQTVTLTVAAGANSAHNLTVKPTFTQLDSGTDIAAVKMLIATSDGGFAALSNANNGIAVDIKGDNTALTSSTVLTVNMYLYYDGNATAVYTNNMANLKGASVSLEFGVTALAA